MSQWKINKECLIFTKKIGKGNFGEVYDGEYLGTRVAIKKLFFVNDELMQKYIEREMDTLTTLAHPNIVQFLGLCIELEDIYIITEFVPGGDLRAILKDLSQPIGWKVRIGIAKDLAAAMNYLHSKNIIHRDLKSHNLLVGDGWKIKVCDFGLARPIDKTKKTGENPNYMTIVGTNEWMAPEVMLGLEYDNKCDVFSYGMVLYELITRDKPPQRLVKNQFGFDEKAEKGNIPSSTPAELWELLILCADRNPENRPEFKEVLKKLNDIMQIYEGSGWPEVVDVVKDEESKKIEKKPVGRTKKGHGGHAAKGKTSAKKHGTGATSSKGKGNGKKSGGKEKKKTGQTKTTGRKHKHGDGSSSSSSSSSGKHNDGDKKKPRNKTSGRK